MDFWKENMEKALEKGNLAVALFHLEALTKSPSYVPDLLKNHCVQVLPTLHHLASFSYREEDIPYLVKLIRIFIKSGYDINKTPECESTVYTALLASVLKKNVIFLECLLRQGARADILDPEEWSPVHWAILNGNLKCIEKFFEHGLAALVRSTLVDRDFYGDNLLSIMMEAAGDGHVEMVRYLMTKEELRTNVKSQLMLVDRWISLRLKLDKALETGNLVEALSHLDALILTAFSSSHVPNLLRNHTVKDLPTFHFLTGFSFQEEDIPRLDKLIEIFTGAGYNVNKTSQRFVAGRSYDGATALMSSVKQQNVIFLECLLRQGAGADIRDRQGFSPCHWTILNGNIKCLEKFLEYGLVALVTSALVDKGIGDDKLRSILHKVVDTRHLEIVRFLMGKKEVGVDAINLLTTLDHWISLKLSLDKAIETSNVTEMFFHLDALDLIASSSSHVRTSISNHTVKGIPILHFLASLHFQEDDNMHLDKLIKIFTDSGYDIDKTTDDARTFGCTALLASVERWNVVLMECLLGQGARTDIRDQRGFSAIHRAIILGDLHCLRKLVEIGNSTLASASFEKSGDMEVYPLLHTAIDECRTEMVLYLLTKEELGVDVNEKAVYRNVRESYRAFTPMGRALFMGTTAIIEALVNHPGVKPSRIRELSSLLENGDLEKALRFLEYFSDEEISTDKVDDMWPLHSTHRKAFSEELNVELTKKLILEYVRRGWDANSLSNSTMYHEVMLLNGTEKDVTLDRYTLLHLACLNKAPEIIKVLVEEARVNVNYKTEGEVELTALQILILQKDWEGAVYLVDKGANLNLRGNLRACLSHPFTQFARKDLFTGNLELNSTFNSVELLVRMGCDGGLGLLDKMLARPEVELQGGNEFHLGLEGNNLIFCVKVLQRCAKIISTDDLNWMADNYNLKTSSLIWFLYGMQILNTIDHHALADLIKVMAELGCDLNISRHVEPMIKHENELLIFHILKYDLVQRTSNLLLRTILQFDSLQLNVTNKRGKNLVEYLLWEWDFRCSYRGMPSQRKSYKIVETIQLLLTHGLEVSGMAIDRHFMYHNGSKVVLKMMYRAGAKILDEFFTSKIACPQCQNSLRKEKEELKEWKEEYDRETRMGLKHICRLEVRRTLKCIGHLKMLDEVPKILKAAVLGTGEEASIPGT